MEEREGRRIKGNALFKNVRTRGEVHKKKRKTQVAKVLRVVKGELKQYRESKRKGENIGGETHTNKSEKDILEI